MRKFKWIGKLFFLCLLISTLAISAFAAETVSVSSVSQLQSAHPYDNNMDKTWIYTHPNSVAGLSITFSADTETENNYDFVYIYDGEGNQVGKYSGTSLAGQSITVTGNVVKIKLTSDSSVQKNGFTVTSISASGEDATVEFAGGNGTASDPYLIETAAQLNAVRRDLAAHYKMVADIVFTDADFAEGGAFYNDGEGWLPIGKAFSVPFTGTFDGAGHTITGLKQDYVLKSLENMNIFYGSMFSYIENATIKNLGMIDSEISVRATANINMLTVNAGGIVGCASESSINNCYNTGTVYAFASGLSSYAHAGGIVGSALDGTTISNCYNRGTLTAEGTGYVYAGGITTYAVESIANCYNAGDIAATSTKSNAYAGGITVSMHKRISNCYNVGTVTANGFPEEIAGVSVSEPDFITNCYYIDTCKVGVSSGADTAIKCTAVQMQKKETFSGFDFNDVWTMDGDEKYPYPELLTKEIVSIDLTTTPAKLVYTAGKDVLDVIGGKITVYYSDKTYSEIILSEDMVSGFDNSVLGPQTLTVTYKGFTDAFDIEIVEPPVQLSVTPNVVNNHIVLFVKADKEITTQVLHIALYSEAGQMLDYIIVPTIEPFTTTNVVFDDDAAVKTAKVFLWDSLTTTTPIADAVEVTVR